MKKWFLSKLLEISAWIGVGIMFASLFLPRDWIFSLGILLIVVHDDTLKNLVNKYAPNFAQWIEGIINEIEE